MSSESSQKPIMEKAKEQEKKCDWIEAAKSYEEVLRSESITVSMTAEIWERIGFCYGRASTQAEDLKEFKKNRELAIEAYKSAAKLFEKEEGLKNKRQKCTVLFSCRTLAFLAGVWSLREKGNT